MQPPQDDMAGKFLTSNLVIAALALFTLAACAGNSFSSQDASPKGSAVGTGDGTPPGTNTDGTTPSPSPSPTPVATGTPPFEPSQVAKIFVTITSPGPSEIDLEIDLNQTNQTYTATFTETILGNNAGGCTVQGAAADFAKVSQALGAVQVGSPTTSLQDLADATLKVLLLDGTTLTFQLSLTGLSTTSVSSNIPMAQANQLIDYINNLQVGSGSCNIP